MAQYSVELNQTPNFWELTRTAHKDTVILRLGRLYDPDNAAISLGTLLQTMNRHASTPGPELLPCITKLDRSKIEQEMISVSDSDPTVKKLLKVRNEYLAHRGAHHVAKGHFKTLPTLQRREIAKLRSGHSDFTKPLPGAMEKMAALCRHRADGAARLGRA